MAKELGYRHGSGVTHVVKRLVVAEGNKPLAQKLADLRRLSIFKR